MTQIKTVTLKDGIKRGDKTISEINVRKPLVPQLKGLKMLDVYQADVNAISILLPRVTHPKLTKTDFDTMSVEDFGELASTVLALMTSNDEIESEDEEVKSE
ncbi:phage tail assembly protein [Actinobacillus equuli subsp. haemolyticus]|uniref:Phage tail assembly protein n=1 Tax=Actinobacillus equuli subsp. equuli TaxID=202947 RepID=A0A9X4JDS9_ACTEU|nr:phage tail assembly protein [Actinobacillus equuli]MDE8034635.1 phage tail assembly protein [Actinobacillus equuli subsp. equuli]MDG4948729.1 phage tail assembly protein [Actinobacillus equuli subsp. haemolyticus]WGE63779.1 phage tail assembly protein [Actinobacillus equuli subsp. haemolyticus]